MLNTTVGRILVNQALPEDMVDWSRTLDKKSIRALFRELADKHPDQYREAAKRLMDVSRDAAYVSGGQSFGLKHLRTSRAALLSRQRLRRRIRDINRRRDWSDEKRRAKIVEAAAEEHERLGGEILEEAKADKNPLADQVLSGARGNPSQLKRLIGGDLLYVDHHDEPIPIPAIKSYAEGLPPAEWFAATFGARKGLADVKLATQDAGYLAKQLNQAAHRLLVTAIDDDEEPDPRRVRGLPVDVDDPDNEGALLARDAGPFKRNQKLTARALKELANAGVKRILVRSPLVGGPDDGGVYARDVGVRERGGLAPLGDSVGLAAAQALSEKLTQGQLCLAAGTMVRMADWATKPIEEIAVGDRVLGADMTGRTFPVTVKNVFDNGTKACVAVDFRYPFRKETETLVATSDHKLLCLRFVYGSRGETTNWEPKLLPVGTPAKAGAFRSVFPGEFREDGQFADYDFAFVLGLFLGDGVRILHDNTPMLSCFDPTLIDDTQAEVRRLGMRFHKMKGHPGQYMLGMIDDDGGDRDALGRVTSGYRNPLKKEWGRFGLIGKYCHEKPMPDEAFAWSNESVAELIAGLWVTDGSVFIGDKRHGKPYLSFGSTSEPLARGVQQLLRWRFGVHSTWERNDYGGRKRPLFGVNINTEHSIRQFSRCVRLRGCKHPRLMSMLDEWRVESPRPLQYGLIRERVADAGERPTYDIEVDHPDHLFVLANGLIVSNSSKHSGGVKGAAQSVSGFQRINQMIQVPKRFRGGAAHAQADGRVSSVVEAPQGGSEVTIDGRKHYVAPGFEVKVKPGDVVEAGDVLSDGLPNPREIVEHKGIGEGRRYFTKAFAEAYRDGGMFANRRNVELLSRGLINHVELTDETEDGVPGDVLPYSRLERSWRPRRGADRVPPSQAVGKYLEQPVLHHSVGTMVRPSMLAELEEFGVGEIDVHDEPPPFKPRMVRAIENVGHDPDWITRFLGSGQKKSLLQAARRGGTSTTAGTSFVPAMAEGVGFGRQWPANVLKQPEDPGRPTRSPSGPGT